MLVRIEELLKKVDLDAPDSSAILVDYRDETLTNGKPYLGALQPLVDKRDRDEVVRESNWVVLVQEPMLH